MIRHMMDSKIGTIFEWKDREIKGKNKNILRLETYCYYLFFLSCHLISGNFGTTQLLPNLNKTIPRSRCQRDSLRIHSHTRYLIIMT